MGGRKERDAMEAANSDIKIERDDDLILWRIEIKLFLYINVPLFINVLFPHNNANDRTSKVLKYKSVKLYPCSLMCWKKCIMYEIIMYVLDHVST